MNPSADAYLTQIGQRIRAERKRLGMTLNELAQQSGLSAPYLSQIENGRVNLNLTSLESISRALQTPLIGFFVNGGSAPVSLLRRSERRWLTLGNQASESLLVKSLSQFEIFVLRLAPGGETEHDSAHPGEEFSYVLRGQVRVILRRDEAYTLEEGDLLYYRSELPHRWQNCGSSEAEILIVNTPATY
ncbi:MAG: cupin domain-containing protein [Anaerolineae bacterium]|nr:cupin domain-containing protein [Anaerolineae bacterium]